MTLAQPTQLLAALLVILGGGAALGATAMSTITTTTASATSTTTATPAAAPAAPPDPATFVGHKIGEDHKLVRWPKIVEYFELLARDTPRVQTIDIGQTTLGNRMIAAIISSPANLANAQKYRDVARRLTDPRTLSEADARALSDQGRAIVAITLNIHSTEIASSQMGLELAYRLATDSSPETTRILDDVILLLIPSLNPDGQIMVCDWYDKYRGTEFEGGRLPWLYHHYAGHDNNRDWFMLNLTETRNVTKFLYHDWFPQALFDQHQQGANGARMFVPPYFDPPNPNVHPLMWRQIELFGTAMMMRMEEHGRRGVVSNSTYDGWRPGDMDTTPWWHNVVALISEAASVRIASPIFLRGEDLTGKQRGLQTYQAQMNFPNPWPGGWWRLRDIVDYELDAAFGFLDAASRYRNTLLFNAYRMNRDAVERGKKEGPYAFVIPAEDPVKDPVKDRVWKNDPWTVRVLADTLLQAGVELHRARTPFTSEGVTYPAGSLVVLMAQPLRPYAKDLLETQAYPDRELYPGGPPEPPYDEAAWSLPLKMGLRVLPVARAFEAALDPLTQADLPKGRILDSRGTATLAFSAESNAATIAVNRLLKQGAEVVWTQDPVRTSQGELPAHSFAVTVKGAGAGTGLEGVSRTLEELSLTAYGVKGSPRGTTMRAPRVGLYQAWGGHMDEGWTRLVFEKFEVPFDTLHNAEIKAGGLDAKYDVIVLPAASGIQLMTGEYSSRTKTPTLPPPYAGGIGTDGVANLLKFVRAGGTVVALDQASEFAIEQFGLPVKNVLAGKKSEEFFCPGSILDVEIDQRHPITAGLPSTAGVFFNASPAFEVQARFGEPAPVTLAAYGPSNPLRSGWLRGEALLHNRGALVDVPAGKGHVVLIGFRTQFRAQTYGTFRILFNSLFASALQPAPTPSPAPALTSAPGR
jgi:hypothetical protein